MPTRSRYPPTTWAAWSGSTCTVRVSSDIGALRWGQGNVTPQVPGGQIEQREKVAHAKARGGSVDRTWSAGPVYDFLVSREALAAFGAFMAAEDERRFVARVQDVRPGLALRTREAAADGPRPRRFGLAAPFHGDPHKSGRGSGARPLKRELNTGRPPFPGPLPGAGSS